MKSVRTGFLRRGKPVLYIEAEGDSKDPGEYVLDGAVQAVNVNRITDPDLVVGIYVNPETGEIGGKPGLFGKWRRKEG